MIWKVVATILSAKQEPNKIPFCLQSLLRRAKHKEDQINSTYFSASFQTLSVFCPSMKYRFNFCMSPDWIDDLSLRPVFRKPRKLVRPVKPFLVHLYKKTEKYVYTPETSCMKGASVHAPGFMLRICEQNSSVIARFVILQWVYGPEKFRFFRETGPWFYIVFFPKQLGLRLKQLVGRHEWRLSGAQVRWRWMVALIRVNALGVNAWPFCVFIRRGTFAEFHSSPLEFIRLTVLSSTKIFFSRSISRSFSLPTQLLSWCFSLRPFVQFHSVARCLSPSFMTRKKLIVHFEIKSPTLQNFKVSKLTNSRQLWHWNGIHWISLAKRSYLTPLQPIKIRFSQRISRLTREMACLTKRCKLQEKNSRVKPHFANAIVALRVARKVERSSTSLNVACV